MISTALFSWKHHLQTLGLAHAWLWTGAVCYARRAGMRCVLVADDAGADYLSYRLGLPFDQIHALPQIPDELTHVRDLTKLSALKLLADRGEAAIHIDYDAFIRKPLPASILTAPFAGEFFYTAKPFIGYVNETLRHKRLETITRGIGGGIMGGTALEQISAVCEESIRIGCHPDNRQAFVEANGYQASVLLGEASFAHAFPDAVELLKGGNSDADEYRRLGYVHLAGLKDDRGAMAQAAELVRLDFPTEYRETFDRWDS
jgi:hypothetical protein